MVVYDLETGKTKQQFPTVTPRNHRALTFSNQGDKLAAAGHSGDLLVFNIDDGKLEATHKISTSAAACSETLAIGRRTGGWEYPHHRPTAGLEFFQRQGPAAPHRTQARSELRPFHRLGKVADFRRQLLDDPRLGCSVRYSTANRGSPFHTPGQWV